MKKKRDYPTWMPGIGDYVYKEKITIMPKQKVFRLAYAMGADEIEAWMNQLLSPEGDEFGNKVLRILHFQVVKRLNGRHYDAIVLAEVEE